MRPDRSPRESALAEREWDAQDKEVLRFEARGLHIIAPAVYSSPFRVAGCGVVTNLVTQASSLILS